jgi:hypothetical protein
VSLLVHVDDVVGVGVVIPKIALNAVALVLQGTTRDSYSGQVPE